MAARRRRGNGGLAGLAICLLVVVLGFLLHDSALGRLLYGTGGASVAPGETTVVFVDVGQGDSTILASNGTFILVDAGDEDAGSAVIQAARDLGVDRFDLVIASHPHSDHIGGMDDVLAVYEADRFMMPYVEHDSKAFERLLDAVDAQGLSIESPKPGDVVQVGDFILTFVHPPEGASYEEMNDYSLVVRVEAPGGTVLLTGDAEDDAEKAMRDGGYDLSADILKVGHHGSKSSTGKKFLNKIQPIYAVISCGVENAYKHPAEKTLETLEEAGVQYFVTSQVGRVTFHLQTGQPIEVTTEKAA